MDKNITGGIEKIEKTSELGYLFWSVLCGVLMAVAYDFLRAKRREKKVAALIVYLEDTVWFVVLGLMLYVLAFRENSGMVRWYSFAATGLGAAVYKLMFGDRVMEFLRRVYGLFVRCLLLIVRVIMLPAGIVLHCVKRPVRVVAWHTRESSRAFNTYFKVIKARISNRLRRYGR